MTTKDLKSEINKRLDEMPEFVLKDILEHLRQLVAVGEDKGRLASNVKSILEEDKKLLDRLAK